MARLRRYLVAGLLVWAPVGATIFVFRLLLGLMERLLFWLPAPYRPEALFDFGVPGLNAMVSGFLAFAVLLATGILAANLIGRRLVSLYESWLARIPFVRTVYGSVKHFVEVVFSDTSQSFKRVLLIQYPHPGMYSLAFQTSDTVGEVQERTGETVVSVFLPTTPNPTSGFILFVPREQIVELDMTVEDALKMIVSLGVVTPRWEPESSKQVELELPAGAVPPSHPQVPAEAGATAAPPARGRDAAAAPIPESAGMPREPQESLAEGGPRRRRVAPSKAAP